VIRAARNSAVARGAGARVRLDPATGAIRAEALEVIGTWHFEGRGETVRGAFGVDGVNVGAVYVEDGFVGNAIAFPRGSRAHVDIPVQQYSIYDLSAGFRLECAVRLDSAGGGRVLHVGETIGLDVTDAGGLRAWFVPRITDANGRDSKGGREIFSLPAGVLPPGVWKRVAVEYDRARFRVAIDGVWIDPEEPSDETAPVWSIDSPLVLGDSQSSFVGALDCLVLSAVGASEESRLPETVRFDPGVPAEIRFDSGGNLDRELHREPLSIDLVYEDGRTASVRVGMYGTVE